jgi:DNA-binding MarR family transcriptional regulator
MGWYQHNSGMSTYLTVRFDTTQHVHDRCLCLAAQRTARVLARHFDGLFRPLGLTSGQFSLLMALNRPEPPSIGAVADLLAMDRTTLTAALKPLERDGIVELKVDPADRRSRRLVLTAAGHRLLASALPIWKREHGKIEALLDDADALRTGLRALA